MINESNKEHEEDYESMSKEEIYDKIEEMRGKWERRCVEKRELQITLVKNKTNLLGPMPYDRKQNLLNIRSSVLERMSFIENQIAWAKRKIRELNIARCRREESEETSEYRVLKKGCVEALVELREEYQQFAADNTRVASMKAMAAKFVLELNPIIRAAVNDKKEKE